MALTKKKTQSAPKKKIPERRCLGCQTSFPKKDLLRVLRTPEGEITIDFTSKKSGRGAYICKKSECLKKAKKTGALSRALECTISEEIYIDLEKEVKLAEQEEE